MTVVSHLVPSLDQKESAARLTVNDGKFLGGIRLVRVAVQGRGLSVSSPSGVSHRGLGEEGLGEVDRGAGDELSELSNLSDLFEEPGMAVQVKWKHRCELDLSDRRANKGIELDG